MTCVIKFNIIITCMAVFQNKYTHIIKLFICYMTNMISLIYSIIFCETDIVLS